MIVGIDLGTSTSEVAHLKNGKPVLIREVAGSLQGILPSIVAIDTDGQVRVGETAAKQLVAKPDLTVQEVKRKMGSDERIRVGAEEFTPQEISARILRHLKEEAEKYLGETVTEAVITVPAYFTDRQRRATRDAAEIAGIRCRRLINEPTAAALAYGLEKPGVEEKILVYDLGGGTLDVTVLELSEGYLDVLASTGNGELGGKDFDERLMTFLHRECLRQTGIDPYTGADRTRLRNLQKFKGASKRAKEELSSADSTDIVIDNIGITADGDPIDFERTVSRAEFEALIGDLVESTRTPIQEALAEKGVRPEEIDTVLMIGGSTRMPIVRRFVSKFFGGRMLRSEISPDEAVALGAAVLSGIEARLIDPGEMVITDVSAHTLGVEISSEIDGEMFSGLFDPIIRKNTTVPRTEKGTYQTTVDFQQWVHVKIYQGDDSMCENNRLVDDFHFEIGSPGPAGQPVEVEMSNNLSGMVEVVARDPRSGKEVRVQVQPDREVMSEEEKHRARTRMAQATPAAAAPKRQSPPAPGQRSTPTETDWRSSPLYAKVAALLNHADTRLGELEGADKVRVNHLANELKAALISNNAAAVTAKEQELIDVLFELD